MKIRYDKYDDAEQECNELNCPNTQWGRYLLYLILWALDHQDNHYEGMSPACYDEFCDNDDEQSDNDEIAWRGVKI